MTNALKTNETNMLLHSIRPRNFLSFGPDTPEIPLRNLNIFIGANGSGKSNLIESICFLRSCQKSISETARQGGGVQEWIWKGDPRSHAHLEVVVSNPKHQNNVRHIIEFQALNNQFHLCDEVIESELASPNQKPPYFFYKYQGGDPVLNVLSKERRLTRESVQSDESIIAQRKDPELYPEITNLGRQYGEIRTYREWVFGRNTLFRIPQRADNRNDRLEEDFSNLGLFLNRVCLNPSVKAETIEYIHDLYEDADDFSIFVEGGTVQVFFSEGKFSIPATRLSDGTLRYLCLLAILCDPSPPPLLCIEEPELGLHPDILPKIAELLVKASQKTQLIVTTHSDVLVDAMTETPECVVVCEKRDGQTEMSRLSENDLRVWLQKYRLGELWTRGDIGGTRW